MTRLLAPTSILPVGVAPGKRMCVINTTRLPCMRLNHRAVFMVGCIAWVIFVEDRN